MEHAHEILQPHQVCLISDPPLLWTLFFSDLAIALAYLLIPLALHLMRPAKLELAKRVHELFPDADPRHILDMKSAMLTCFQVFIVACSSTHLFNALTMWVPLYGLSAVSHATAAAVSLAVAVAFLVAGYRLRH